MKDYQMSIDVDTSVMFEQMERMKRMIKYLPEEINMVGGPCDGISYYATLSKPASEVLVIKFDGISSVYKLGVGSYYRYYEWITDYEYL